jgi:hypothetical protein
LRFQKSNPKGGKAMKIKTFLMTAEEKENAIKKAAWENPKMAGNLFKKLCL